MEPKPALDDPSFQARRPAPAAPPAGTSAPVIPPIFPESALLPQPTPLVPRDAVPPVPPPRPLLELFPQASGRVRVREPRIGGTPSSLMLDREMPESVIDDTITPGEGDDDVPLSPGRRMARMVTLAVMFLMLMLAGAGAAAWVFRDEVSRLRSQWQGAPP